MAAADGATNRGKIFGVGLSRTGTRTLTEALRLLDFSAVHFLANLDRLDNYDAAFDTPVAANFELLDRRYPGSKFIHTVRDLEPWLESCRRFFELSGAALQRADFQRLHIQLYETASFDADLFAAGYRRHETRVRDYFRDRPEDFLIMDICAEIDGWPELCGFLGRPIPGEPFPWQNSAAADDAVLIRWLHLEQVGPDNAAEYAAKISLSARHIRDLLNSPAYTSHDLGTLLAGEEKHGARNTLVRMCKYYGGAETAARRLNISLNALMHAVNPMKHSQSGAKRTVKRERT